MVTTWLEAYSELNSYISDNPAVILESDRIEIPEGHREQFYALFNNVRSLFVQEEFPKFLEHSKQLAESYINAESRALENNCLNEILLPPYLRWFVNDQNDGLRRVIYNPLFDLLRQKTTVEKFRSLGRKYITSHYSSLKVLCYQYWVLVNLTNLLRPESYYYVNLSLGTSSAASVQGAVHDIKPVRKPEMTDSISLAHSLYNIFIVPQVLVYSTAIDRFVAIRSEPTAATWTAENRSKNIEWLPVGQQPLMSGLITINTSDKLEDLALVRDVDVFARPDMAFICREPEKWYEQSWVEQFEEMNYNHEILKPRKGLFVLSRPDVPEEFISKIEFQSALRNLSDQEDTNKECNIKIVNTGLEEKKLSEFVSILDTREKH